MIRNILIGTAALGLMLCGAHPAFSSDEPAQAPAPAPANRAGSAPDPALASNYEKGGDVMVGRGDLRGALLRYRNSAQVTRALVQRSPQDAALKELLASRLDKAAYAARMTGNVEVALALYQERLVVVDRLAAASPGDLGRHHEVLVTLQGLGDLLLATGKEKTALATFEKALAKATQINAAGKNDATLANLSIAEGRMGLALLRLRRYDDSRQHYEQALAISADLARKQADDPFAIDDHATSLSELGTLELAAGHPARALAHLEQAHQLRTKLVAAHPDDPRIVHSLAKVCEHLGRAEAADGNAMAANARMLEGLDHIRRLTEASGGSTDAALELIRALERAGDTSLGVDDAASALRHHREGLALRQKLAKHDRSQGARRLVALGHAKVGQALEKKGDLLEAAQCHRQAVEIHSTLTSGSSALAKERAELKRALAAVRAKLPK